MRIKETGKVVYTESLIALSRGAGVLNCYLFYEKVYLAVSWVFESGKFGRRSVLKENWTALCVCTYPLSIVSRSSNGYKGSFVSILITFLRELGVVSDYKFDESTIAIYFSLGVV